MDMFTDLIVVLDCIHSCNNNDNNNNDNKIIIYSAFQLHSKCSPYKNITMTSHYMALNLTGT